MIESIISWYAPHHCLGCNSEGDLLCYECAQTLPTAADRCYRCRALSPGGRTCVTCRRHSKLYAVRAATGYEFLAKELVGRLKFSGARTGARSISTELAQLNIPPEAALVPVPTATGRVRLRGYDQAMLITKQLAHVSDEDYLQCLHRIGQHRQLGASRAERLAQMSHSFEVYNEPHVVGRHIVLVDDVMTTGATLESAAAALKEAGATRVEAVVFARA